MGQGMILIVSGPPAAGKTTLAAKLGAALGWPVFGKDAIKEHLYDSIGTGDAAFSSRLGRASITLLCKIAAWEVAAARSVIVEGNFHREFAVPEFAALERHHGCALREVHCTAAPEVLLRRLRERWEGGTRHPGHVKDAQPALYGLTAAMAHHLPVLDPPHLLTVDTSDFATVDDAAIITAARRLVQKE